ncbi:MULTISPECIES: RNA polymerase sigma factor SigW [Paenibacillus]|uniref:RNA polymerase sigma factor n=4 Tax=Paenibacillus TaxID=44249 RepID=A0ABU3RGR2_9BACL|nr:MULTISPECIES: RNA polymerase sigma factor SigW [Paenibacillus]MBA2939281.1 RNA polymerase sigma factor SigW [Paenibacillus sp. CGMCC 1.16610]MCY9661065.1 RNA polymerase sigma factor SigW [Paenibacillus anseongense]MDU0203481.1 RNA polymerase sigma factor SigW [Paenibacillus sp. PFR10]MEB4794814.1 RNA polymerase sigma factor SigW [Paenibacillus chondroitinus]MVQ35240.1 RNA polymerase sigma factor SigW [Paenibacillus anseongense]
MNVAELQLIQLSRRGDRNAFVELVELYRNKIQKLAFRMLHNRPDSEDIVQETFIRVYLNLNHYDESQNFSTWIYRIGKNVAIDLLRKKRPVQSLDAELSDHDDDYSYYSKLASQDQSPEHAVLQTEIQDHMHTSINKLADKYKSVITLYYLEELSLQEISTKLNLPITTVKTRLHRGRELLRKKWGMNFVVGLMVFFTIGMIA